MLTSKRKVKQQKQNPAVKRARKSGKVKEKGTRKSSRLGE